MGGFNRRLFLLLLLAYAAPTPGLAQQAPDLDLLRHDYHACVDACAHRYLAAGNLPNEIVEDAMETCSDKFEQLSTRILDVFEIEAGSSAISRIFAREKANDEIARTSQQARKLAALIASTATEAYHHENSDPDAKPLPCARNP